MKAADALEADRGFQPPMFIDIRIKRAVRAKGFVGGAFEKLVGARRYRWMKSLGNKRIVSGQGRSIQIAEPSTVAELLDIATEAAESNHRVVFFCSCLWPKCDVAVACHRRTVSTLLTRRAKREGIPLEVAEWPGGRSSRIHIEVKPRIFEKVTSGRIWIPLGKTDRSPPIRGSRHRVDCHVSLWRREGPSSGWPRWLEIE